MDSNIKKWSILTEKEFKELDITLKSEYIKRYGRQFYPKQVQNGLFNKGRSPFPGRSTDESTSQTEKEE